MTARSLDDLLARARLVEVRPSRGAQVVAEVVRDAAAAPGPRTRAWWIPALAVCAAVAAVMMLSRRAVDPAADPQRLGPRVAIIAAPGARYQVAAVDDDHADIIVEQGAITARLWHGPTPYRLTLRGGGVEALAVGTIYTLAVEDGIARVHVHDGTVRVTAAGALHVVPAASTWSSDASTTDEPIGDDDAGELRALGELAALPAPVRDARRELGPIVPPPAVAAPPAPTTPVSPSPAAVAAPRAPVDRWRWARELRAQGHPEQARRELRNLAALADPTWSPLAQVEAIRIDLDVLTDPEDARAVADAMLARWPKHALAAEVRTLRCRALDQLGQPCGS
jgi:hypothetical protein